MEGNGVVTSVQGSRARVKIAAGAECAGCAARNHCHGSEPREREITVINSYGAKVGEYVVFEARASRVVISALVVWILPILSMIAGYLIAERLIDGFVPILMAFVFLILSFTVLKTIDNAVSGGTSFYPAITGLAGDEPPSAGCPEYAGD